VLHRSGKLGLGSAYRRASNWPLPRERYLIEMDADFSIPDSASLFLETIQNADLVIDRATSTASASLTGLFAA